MARLRYNGLSTALGAGLTNSATTITFSSALTHSGGTAVPTITGTDYIPLSILDSTSKLSEVVWLTAYTTGATTGTILRGQEGTTGVTHSSSDRVVHGTTTYDATSALTPTYAGPRRNHFDPRTSWYNLKPSNTVKLRALLAKTDAQRVRIQFWGHSGIAGGGTTALGRDDIPAQLKRYLKSAGVNINGSGFVMTNNNLGAAPGPDSRYTFSAGWTQSSATPQTASFAYTTATGTHSAVFQSDEPGTIVELVTANTTAAISIYIDDVFQETYTGPGGTAAYVTRTYSSLSNRRHKVEIRSTAALATFVGVRVRNSTGLEISNLAMGGADSGDWVNAAYNGIRVFAMGTAGPPDIVIMSLGANDLVQSGIGALSTMIANLQTILTDLQTAGVPVIFCTESKPNPGGSIPISDADWNTWMDAYYDLADQYDIPMLDQTNLIGGSYQAASDAGLVYTDNFHLNTYGYDLISRGLFEGPFSAPNARSSLSNNSGNNFPSPYQTDELSIPAQGTSGTIVLDLNKGRYFTVAPTGAVTAVSITNPPPSGVVVTVRLKVVQSSPAYAIATPSGGVFYGTASPTQVANKKCLFDYVTDDGGATWDCSGAVQM